MTRLLFTSAFVCALLAGQGGAAATRLIGPGDDLQAALNAARPGDVLLLQAGATFVGNFVLPVFPGRDDAYVMVRSSSAGLPGAVRRISPETAALLPKIVSPNDQPAVRTAPGAHHWALSLLEISASRDGVGDIVRLGDGSAAQRQLSDVPHHLVIDRCYVHGHPATAQKRGIALNSGEARISNSWIAEVKQAGQDSQAIAGWNGPGPFTITNNCLSAAGQGFMLGGADPAIPGLVPSGVLFQGNYVTRPREWRGSRWQVKNLLELKNARNVTIEDNVFENNWRGAQAGHAILFTPRNQDGRSPWATVEHVTFRYNVVRHVAAALTVVGRDSPNASGVLRGLRIEHNLFYDVDGGAWGGNGDFLLIGSGPSDVVVEHNTVLQSGNVLSAYGGTKSSPTPIPGFVFRANLVRHNAYGVHGTDRGVGNDTLAAFFPAVVFSDNVLAGGSASAYPAGNAFPGAAEFEGWFTDPSNGDYRVKTAVAGRNLPAGSGADIDKVAASWRAAAAGLANTRNAKPRPDHDRDRE
jgi:hypothetical protein